MNLEDQELIFQYFSNTLEAVIRAEKSRGDYDQGIMSVKASSVTIDKQSVIHTDTQSGAQLQNLRNPILWHVIGFWGAPYSFVDPPLLVAMSSTSDLSLSNIGLTCQSNASQTCLCKSYQRAC